MTADEANLHGYGQVEWPRVQDLLGDATCCWADIDGWHVDPLPSQPPCTTHLWAWTNTVQWRLRVDGSKAIVAMLGSTEHAPPGATATERTSVLSHQAPGWPENDNQVHVRGNNPAHWTWQIRQTSGASPITFVRATPTASGASVSNTSD
jgi:hypothetical protein